MAHGLMCHVRSLTQFLSSSSALNSTFYGGSLYNCYVAFAVICDFLVWLVAWNSGRTSVWSAFVVVDGLKS